MDTALIKYRNRIKMKKNNIKLEPEKNNYIGKLFTRTLISVILVLLCAIFINISDKNLIMFKDYLFNDTLAFTKINELYTKYFGSIVPQEIASTIPVFDNGKNYTNIEKMDNSFKVSLNSNTFSFLEGGIVVFIGEKDGLGKTIIVQGNDGVDIWYSNLSNVNIKMYDYVEKDNIIGEFSDNFVILTLMEEGEYIGYSKYLS